MARFPMLKAALSTALLALSLPASAIFTNGGFETGDFTGWTSGFGVNNGLQGAQPYSSTSISIEPPRFLRRLKSLRGLSHEEVEQVFP